MTSFSKLNIFYLKEKFSLEVLRYINFLNIFITNKMITKISFYLLFIFSPFLYVYIYSFLYFMSKYIREKTTYTYLMIVSLSMIISTRVQTGDIKHYKNFYGVATDIFLIPSNLYKSLSSTDYLFGYYTYVVRLFTFNNFSIYLFITILFSLSIIYIGFKNVLKSYWIVGFLLLLSTPIYSMIISFTIRQGLALSFVLLSLIALFNNYKRKSLIFTFIACLFHSTAFLLIPFLIIVMIFNNSRVFLFFIFSILFSLLLIFTNIDVFSSMINLFTFNDFIYNKLISYSLEYKQELNNFFTFDILKSIMLFMIVILNYRLLKTQLIYVNAFLYFLMIQLLFFSNSVLFMRLSSYKDIILILVVALILNKIVKEQKKFILIILILTSFIINFYYTFMVIDISVDVIKYGSIFFLRNIFAF